MGGTSRPHWSPSLPSILAPLVRILPLLRVMILLTDGVIYNENVVVLNLRWLDEYVAEYTRYVRWILSRLRLDCVVSRLYAPLAASCPRVPFHLPLALCHAPPRSATAPRPPIQYPVSNAEETS